MAKKAKMKVERRVGFKEESFSSPDLKFGVMLKNMEKLVDKLTPPRGENQPQVRNPNFKRPLVAQNCPREQKTPEEQQPAVRPPFLESFVDKYTIDEEDHQIGCFDDKEIQVLATKEEHDIFVGCSGEKDNIHLCDSVVY